MGSNLNWKRFISSILEGQIKQFAIISRESVAPLYADLMILDDSVRFSLESLELNIQKTYLLTVPYRTLKEKGFCAQDDEASLHFCEVLERVSIPKFSLIDELPDPKNFLDHTKFDISDEDYAEIVSRIIYEDIGTGKGSNFVIKRSLCGSIKNFDINDALGYFKKILIEETGAYWSFIICLNDVLLIGASPERHASCTNHQLAMTPISGTLRLNNTPINTDTILDFVNDAKETDELFMVLDEELKMVSKLCPNGGIVCGPKLRYMSKVVHTEYEISGYTDAEPQTILWETMFAPTVIGSPIESAARVIAERELSPRGYYSGVAALIEPCSTVGIHDMDSIILIRTASISPKGEAVISVGSTIVRHSDPYKEAVETTAKAESLIGILSPVSKFNIDREKIAEALHLRAGRVSKFWSTPTECRTDSDGTLVGKKCLVLNAEDDFTNMIAVILKSLGMRITVTSILSYFDLDEYDIIVFGPGPGNPLDDTDPRILRLRAVMRESLKNERAFLAVCLSHQIFGRLLGLKIRRLVEPHQGMQNKVMVNNKIETVGFYNTYVVSAQEAVLQTQWGIVDIRRHIGTEDVYAISGKNFISIQCHLESVLTLDGKLLLRSLIEQILGHRRSNLALEA